MSDSGYTIIQFLADVDDDKVYIAQSAEQNGLFVLRLLSPQTAARVQDELSNLVQQGSALQSLNHPNIKPIINYVYHDGSPALVLPYYEGQSAADFLAMGQPMPIERVVRVALKLVDALEIAHRQGLYHGALRPQSVILGIHGGVLLSEWGGNIILPPFWYLSPYVAPELRAGDIPSAHTDLWSLGALMFHLLTLQHPASDQTLSDLLPDCPPTLVDLIERLLDTDPYARPYDAALVGKLLERERPPQERTRFTPNYPTMPGLPLRTTHFFNRESETEQLMALLHHPEKRIINICGPTGSGRSTLMLELAHRMLQTPQIEGAWQPEEIFVVRFMPDSRPDHLILSLTLITDASFEYRLDLLQQVLDFLDGRRALLILDDIDNFMEGITWVSAIIYDIPTLKCLMSSEKPLNLSEETILSLSGIIPSLDANLDAPALRLFESAARRRIPSFKLMPENASEVIKLIRRVGGAPLSIVLAAGGVGDMAIEELTTNISDALNVSSTSDLNFARIKAVFEFIWLIISRQERDIITSLSVIRGEISQEAAYALSRATPAQLRHLVGRSLLQRVPETGGLTMHPLIYACVQEWFKATSPSQQIWHDHSAYFLRLLVREGRRTAGTGQTEASRLITTNLENIRPAWQWAITNQHFEAIDEAAEPLYNYLIFTLRLDEGDFWYTPAVQALQTTPATPRRDTIMASLLFYHAILTRHDMNSQKALRLIEQAESLTRTGWTLRVNVLALNARGLYELMFGSTQRARAILEQMLTLALYEYNPRSEMIASVFLGAAQYFRTAPERIALEHGKALLKRGLELCTQTGDETITAVAYLHLGMIHAISKDPQTALDLFQKGLKATSTVNNPRTRIPLLTNIIELSTELGNHTAAQEAIRQLTELSRIYGHPWATALALINLAQMEMLAGNYREANHLCLSMLRRLQHDPRSQTARVTARCIYAYGLCCLGEYEEALQQVRVTMDDLDQDDPTEMSEVWSWIAILTYWGRDYAEAMVVIESVLQRYQTSFSPHHRALLYAGYANSAVRLNLLDMAQPAIIEMSNAMHEVVSYDYRGSPLLNLLNPRLFSTLVMIVWLDRTNQHEEARTRMHGIIPLAIQTNSPHMLAQALAVGSVLLIREHPQQASTWLYAVIEHPKTPHSLRTRIEFNFEHFKESIPPRILLSAAARAKHVNLIDALRELRTLL